MLSLADGDEADLHRGEPEGEGPGVVLDEHAEEALDRAEERAVDHDGPVQLAVFALVFELESRGQVEVELHGGELPHAAEDVHELDVDLGAVEGGFAWDGAVRESRGDPGRASASRWRCFQCSAQPV